MPLRDIFSIGFWFLAHNDQPLPQALNPLYPFKLIDSCLPVYLEFNRDSLNYCKRVCNNSKAVWRWGGSLPNTFDPVSLRMFLLIFRSIQVDMTCITACGCFGRIIGFRIVNIIGIPNISLL